MSWQHAKQESPCSRSRVFKRSWILLRWHISLLLRGGFHSLISLMVFAHHMRFRRSKLLIMLILQRSWTGMQSMSSAVVHLIRIIRSFVVQHRIRISTSKDVKPSIVTTMPFQSSLKRRWLRWQKSQDAHIICSIIMEHLMQSVSLLRWDRFARPRKK